ncbi:MAG: carboxypeptidase-like regulatory domain-containing protein [Capnocytophaga sp.]|nr:carboxypeptidase-like regulatory domain-containing protein [Capnocytophaga sp.]
MKKYSLLLLFYLYLSFNVAGQIHIKGKIIDNTDKKTISNAMVLFYDDTNNKILEYTQTNEEGKFNLSKSYKEGIYKIEVSKLGYNKNYKQIIIGTDSNKYLEVEISIKVKAIELEGVTLTENYPIVVKKDTILYDIPRLTEKHDESLEQVLAKINGFEVLGNGEIRVNGKLIRKVLVDGKEISDYGASLITKSLSPEKVEKVEVRFDEKNKKIKESLLDDERFVVLDITLKPNVSKSFFGKQHITSGYQNNIKLGGLTNLFSLNEKTNIQLFLENNNFGNNTIQLSEIRNIGEESFSKIFTTPVDIEDIKNRDTYQEEMYGFHNFTANDNAIGGLSINFPLSEKTDLYVGSFNNYHFLRNQFQQQTFFDNTLIYNQQENNFINEYNSKNKIQLKYTADNLKISSDFNYVYFDQKLSNAILNNNTNQFLKKHYTTNIYFNANIEYLLTEKVGSFANFSFSDEKFNIHTNLYSNNANIYTFLGIIDNFQQHNYNKQTIGQGKVGVTYKSEYFGTQSFGYKYHSNTLENEKVSNVIDFNASNREYASTNNALFYDNTLFLGDFDIDVGVEYSWVRFPYLNGANYGKQTKGYFQYEANVTYNIDQQSRIIGRASHQLDYYPLQKATFGNVLTDFQNIYVTSQVIAPYYNDSYGLTLSKTFNNKSHLIVSYNKGVSNNLNTQTFNNNFIFTNANQRTSNYHLFSTQYKGRIKRLLLSYTAEPEFIFNTSEYLYNNKIETTTAYRFLYGLKLTQKPHKQVSIFYYPKYNYFVFRNSINNNNRIFDFLRNKISVTAYFFNKQLLTEVGFQQVNFLQTGASFNNFDARIVYKTKKYRWFLEMENLLNSKYFTTEDFNKSLLNVNRNSVFERYFNIGFEFKIN